MAYWLPSAVKSYLGDERFISGHSPTYCLGLDLVFCSILDVSVPAPAERNHELKSGSGGLCVTAILSAIFPSFMYMENTLPISSNTTTPRLIGWVLYNVVTTPLLYIPPEKTRRMLMAMNLISIVTLVSMMIYLLSAAHGAGPLLSAPATAASGSELGWAIVQGVTTVIGGIAVGLTNQPDYSRFARRPGDQVFGQWFSILT